MQIKSHSAGMLPVGTMQPQEFGSTLEFEARGLSFQLFRKEAAIEVAVDSMAASGA